VIMDHAEKQEETASYQFITNQIELENQVALWQSEPFLAIDTEFMRTNTFYAKPGLIQIADSNNVFIIDPLVVTNLKPISTLLENHNIVKVMHSMSEDVELLFHATEAQINQVFDTQIAAAFLGYGPSLGYQKLVSLVLGFEVDKSETRSDWLKRPLTDSQIEYAAKDAEYLVLLYQKLESELIEHELLEAVFNETAVTNFQTFESWRSPETAYLKLRAGWDLSLSSQQLLQSLVSWRDALAKTSNVPKSWVFSDAQLIEVAGNPPKTATALKQIKGIQFKSLRLYGEALFSEVVNFKENLAQKFIYIDAPVKGKELVLYKKLKQCVSEVEEETGISTQLLGSRKMLERAVIHLYRNKGNDLPLEFQGWRMSLLGDSMLAICSANESS